MPEMRQDTTEPEVIYRPLQEQQSAASQEDGLTTEALPAETAADAESRNVPLRAMQKLPPTLAEVERGLTMLHSIRGSKRQSQVRKLALGVVVSISFILLFMGQFRYVPGAFLFVLPALLLMRGIGAFVGDYMLERSKSEVVDRLIVSREPKAAGALAEEWLDNDRRRSQIYPLLLDLLPKVKAGDGAYFSAEHKRALLRLLEWPDMDLVCAALKAIGQVSGEESLHTLKILAASKLPALAGEARAALASIDYRKRRQQERNVLLRGVSSPAVTPPEQLLRAASGTASRTPEEYLLHPDEEERSKIG